LLRVRAGGGVAAAGSEGFHWVVHRRATPVAFLATPLLALGDGDELDVTVTVEAGAGAVVTAQGPGTLLKTGQAATQRWRLELAAAAHLTFLPWLTIPYPGSRSRLEVTAELGQRSTLVAWETLAAGRVATGERFLFEELHASWRIADPAGLLLHDRLAVRGSQAKEAETMLAGRTHLGALYVAGLDETALPLSSMREALRSHADLAGVSRPAPELVVARALDTSGERLERAFWQVVSQAREAAGQPPLDPVEVARRWF
jgi:urease accessory protein